VGAPEAAAHVTLGSGGRTSAATSAMASLPTAYDGDVNLRHRVLEALLHLQPEGDSYAT
jgi:hypothetical protein